MSAETPHGYNRYTYGCRCDVCRAAKAEYIRNKRAAHREYALPVGDGYLADIARHGSQYGYQEQRCRCLACVEAHRLTQRRQYQRLHAAGTP